MKYILSLATVLVFVPGYWACKTVEELDQCAYEISFLSNRGLVVPSDDAGVVDLCNKAKAGLKCLADHARDCAKGAMKSLTIKVMNDLERHLHTRCDNPDERAEFLKHVQCFHDQSKIDSVRLCADKHMVMLEKVSNLPKPLRLGGACCSSHSLRDCAINKITSLCSGETGDYFNEMIGEIAEENIELVCKEYSDTDRCAAKYDPATWAELKAIMDSEDPAMADKHKYKTVVPLIVKMLKEARK